MTAMIGLGGVCWGIILAMVGLTYVPQFIDGFFWDFLLRLGYVLGVVAIGGALSIAIALVEARDPPAKEGEWTNPMAD